MSDMKTDTLRVPGASLYYTARGSGPLLLVLQGGPGDAEGSSGLAPHLVDHFTVVSYDRRGLSRSKLDAPPEALPLETHSDDVHRLLAALTTEPAFVVGVSIGALLGLDLTARHPEQVRTLVAFEAPAPELLPEAERARAARSQEEVEETYRHDGVLAAMKKFMVLAGMDFNDREPDVELPRPSSQHAANMEFFLTHDAPAVRGYKLDIAALLAAKARIVPGCGRTNRETWPHHCGRALGERLGREVTEFPGGHNGYAFHPKGFAATLREVFAR